MPSTSSRPIDTPPLWELNVWYHTLNAGFRTRISGETDFPCIYGDRVGLGRSYVRLDKLSYDGWTEGIRDGRAYVTDGKSHLVDFRVDDRHVGVDGSELRLQQPGTVRVRALVAARLDERPDAVDPQSSRRRETVLGSRTGAHRRRTRRGGRARRQRCGRCAPSVSSPTARCRKSSFPLAIERSSWVALRILPSSHTNPIFVVVGGQPIRASRASVEWCLKSVDRLWSQKSPQIAPRERDAAAAAYEQARAVYRQRLAETSAGAPAR